MRAKHYIFIGMKNIKKSLILFFSLLLFLPLQDYAKEKPDPETDLIKRMIALYENSKNFTAGFSQVVIQKNPSRTLKKKGEVFFKKPLYMKWHYKEPEEVYYISDGNIFYCHQVEDAIVYKKKIADPELYSSLKFMVSPSEIEKDFIITKGTKGADNLVQFVLEPKKATGNFKKLFLYVEEQTAKVKKTMIIDPLDNESTISFENESSGELPEDFFKFTPPEGVRVEEL
jgi:chaperone LolA